MRQGFRMLRDGSVNQIGLARCDNEELMQNVMKRTLGLVFPIFFLTATLHAADVRVTDSGGIEVLVKDITIDYSGLLGSDKETEGVRVSQGEALVTAKWTDIQSITITGRDAAAARMTVEILLRDGKKVVGHFGSQRPNETERQGRPRRVFHRPRKGPQDCNCLREVKAVIQRVSRARVVIGAKEHSHINNRNPCPVRG